MRQIDREDDAMSASDDDVSPYLRRPLRSYEEVVSETSKDPKPEDRFEATSPLIRGSGREATGDV